MIDKLGRHMEICLSLSESTVLYEGQALVNPVLLKAIYEGGFVVFINVNGDSY
jgi:pyridoxine/pyridoxamine 5'-phosphate oxidase